MTHAFFKGLLFLAAGSVIHAVGGNQDMRYMGGLEKVHPVDIPDNDGWPRLPSQGSRRSLVSSARTRFSGRHFQVLKVVGFIGLSV